MELIRGGQETVEKDRAGSVADQSERQRVWEVASATETASPYPELEDALEAANSFFRARLFDGFGRRAREYLVEERGFTPDTAEEWELGYALPSWNALSTTLGRRGFSEEVIVGAGLAGQANNGRLYDFMRGRLMFPVRDATGSLRGFAGRLITGDGPKYLNGPATPLYDKGSLLYGLDRAKSEISEVGEAVVVEGYTDVLAAHQEGMTNVVATCGTALTSEHVELLSLLTPKAVLTFDGDLPGLTAARRAADLLRTTTSGVDLRVATLPFGQDAAEIFKRGDGEIVVERIEEATPLVWQIVDQVLVAYDLEEVEAPIRAAVSCARQLKGIPASEQVRAVERLADRTRLSEDDVRTVFHDLEALERRRESKSLARGF